jgi:predicted ATP-grasp superfamily ATP-dependent carboligase
MNILFASFKETLSFVQIFDSILHLPAGVTWKILGNREYHSELISIFGNDRVIHFPMTRLNEPIGDDKQLFSVLEDLPNSYIIVPTDFQSLKFLSKYSKHFGKHILCPHVDVDKLIYLDDKFNIREIAFECGVFSPTEYGEVELEKVDRAKKLVIKPRLGDGSSGVYFSKNKMDAINYLYSLSADKRRDQVIEDYISGEDFYYYGICRKGKVLISAIIKPGTLKYLGIHFVSNDEIEENARKIVEHFDYSGPITIDFRVENGTNIVYLIEINPRNGSNIHLFNLGNVNWLFELAKMSENSDFNPQTRKVLASKFKCYLGITWKHFFYKFSLYKVFKLRYRVNPKIDSMKYELQTLILASQFDQLFEL